MLESPVLSEELWRTRSVELGCGERLGLPDGGRISDELVDELLAGARTPEELPGPDGLLAQLTKRLIERAMSAELDEHLGYSRRSAPCPQAGGNSRNGSTPKTLHTDHGSVSLDGPRDRDGTFEPQIVKKGQRRFDGFDEKILALYARGLTCVTSRPTCRRSTAWRSATTSSAVSPTRSWRT